MRIRINRFRHADHPAWEGFVARHPRATAYHHPAWLGAVEQAYGHRGWLVSAWQDGTLLGVLPVCQLRRPGRDSLVSLPFCDLGGPLSLGEDSHSALSEGARALLEDLGIGRIEIRERGLPLDEASVREPDPELPGEKVSMLVDLPDTPEALFDGFRAKLRSQIRKAGKNGLAASVETGPDAIEAFYPVFAANMRRLGSPVHSKAWFQALREGFGEQLLVGLVRLEDRVVAAGIVLVQGRQACIPWASTLARYNHLAPNMLLYWQCLSESTRLGCPQFDFGRSTLGEGTYRFKRQWGAWPLELQWQYWHPDGRVTNAMRSGPGKLAQHSRHLVEACWQRLPLALANRIGPHVRKHISL